jgi:hypothetical protein
MSLGGWSAVGGVTRCGPGVETEEGGEIEGEEGQKGGCGRGLGWGAFTI